MSDKLRDVYQCKRCESNCIITSKQDDDGNSWDGDVLYGQLCSCSEWVKTTEPKHETVQVWEERTGETYPDDGPVWSCYRNLLSANNEVYWKIEEWEETKQYEWDSPKPAIVATHHGKPEVK
jgi:hypothetical protein